MIHDKEVHDPRNITADFGPQFEDTIIKMFGIWFAQLVTHVF